MLPVQTPYVRLLTAIAALVFLPACTSGDQGPEGTPTSVEMEKPPPPGATHAELEEFFLAWRAFERPPFENGVPDYTEPTMSARHAVLPDWQHALATFDTTGWTTPDRVDFELVRAEMSGLDFEHRVRRPWQRDPGFYKVIYMSRSDVPAHEGPENHAYFDWWALEKPLSAADAQAAAEKIGMIPAFYEQARTNLTGNARDLWFGGIRVIEEQEHALRAIAAATDDANVRSAADEALAATESFGDWLEAELASKNGPSGIGKDNYTWYLNNVHLMPWSWEEEVTIMERELARSWAYLKLAEHSNRTEPPRSDFRNEAEYRREMIQAVDEFMAFLDDGFVSTRPYMRQAMLEHIGTFVADAGERSFFTQINSHDAMPMRPHMFHWIELAMHDNDPHERIIRSALPLYNIYDGRSEGLATGLEEMMLAAGLMDDRPRAKELIYIMLGQRAARALGGLYMHGNELTMAEASEFAVTWTPRGWMRADGELVVFEQHLYLQQPGYGSSYITGKVEIEDLMRVAAHDGGDDFSLQGFMDTFLSSGIIPTSLVRWEMTGDESHYRSIITSE